ncbi:MAG: DNA recombination protein RmuC, partial [Candidatus Ornithomonoglobus sp.]
LGEMQGLAQGVGDLKKVLTNVKARGIMGEMQLGAILEQIMAPEQYAENIATVPGSKNVVEFAIRLPDRQGNTTWLPIDSKFPSDTYAALVDAYESGDKAAVDAAAKQLRTRILSEAKDIHEKYVSPPATTDFAIMFLPFEGLYAEVVNRGLVEELQNTYRITVAGPSTMAAMLNSISMGFKTLAIEKRSSEVWQVLGAVKTEFTKFESVLTAAQNRINQANAELDKLVGVRTRAINRRLRTVEQLEEDNTDLLGIGDADYTDDLM